MGEIVNLRQAKKARRRADEEQQAERNRAVFGRPKAERLQTENERSLAERRHESHRREDG